MLTNLMFQILGTQILKWLFFITHLNTYNLAEILQELDKNLTRAGFILFELVHRQFRP